MPIEAVMKSLDRIEADLAERVEKAEGQLATVGKASEDLLKEIEGIGLKQRELAADLLNVQQRLAGQADGAAAAQEDEKNRRWGPQLVKSTGFESFMRGETNRARMTVKNTLTGGDATVAPDRKPGIVGGAFQPLTLESLIPSVPTASNAVEFTREVSFTNSAAETAEGDSKPESSITFELVTKPVATVAHWLKISRQLAADNAALAAYVDQRLRYGVNRKVESQLVVGNGTAPALHGFMAAGNYTAHGYLSGALGSVLPKLVLIRKVIGDLWNAGYPADAIVLNAIDWAAIETELLTTQAGQVRVSYSEAGDPLLFGVPVVQSVGMAQDTFVVGSFKQAATVHNREEVVVEMSDSDADNFTKNLVTIRAERRLCQAVEVPAALRGGDLTPPAS